MKNYTTGELVNIAEKIYQELGGKQSIIKRIKNYEIVPRPENLITNFYYIYQDVFDYNNLNALLALTVLYLDAIKNDQKSRIIEFGNDYKEIMLNLVEINYLIDHTFCDKAFDGHKFALIAHSWLYLKENSFFETIFAPKEIELIENWLHERAGFMYEDRDKKVYETFRPYDNQETGIGALIILGRLLEQKDNELSNNLLKLADERLVGWKSKLGNPDDTLFYTPIMMKTLYFYAIYRPNKDILGYDNCRKTFELFLHKTAPDGLITLYNWMFAHSYPDFMALGAKLYNDGRYKWLANKILFERLEERTKRYEYSISKIDKDILDKLEDEERAVIQTEINKQGFYDHVWEGLSSNIFHLWLFWDDSISPVCPDTGSVVLEKSAGENSWPDEPGPVIPEKIIFRDGWEEDDLFAVLNIWGGKNHSISGKNYHRYPATNEITTLNYKEPFLVQATNILSRDVMIKREELNAFNIKRDNEWLNDHVKTYNAQINIFEKLSIADFSKTKLVEYFGWENERSCINVKDDYFVVFDYCFGAQRDDIGILWHLKGDLVNKNEERLDFELLDRKLSVLFPHKKSWYETSLDRNRTQNPVYQHQADFDLTFESSLAKEKGFITIFAPNRGRQINAELVDVKYFDVDAYPLALGVVIREDNYRDLVGVHNNKFLYPYNYNEEIITDSEIFVLRQYNDLKKINFTNGKMIKMKCDKKPKEITYNRVILDEKTVKFEGGYLFVIFEEFKSGTVEVREG